METETKTVEKWLEELPEIINWKLLFQADYITLIEKTPTLLDAFNLVKQDIIRSASNSDVAYWEDVEKRIKEGTLEEHPDVILHKKLAIESFKLKILSTILDSLNSLNGIYLKGDCKKMLEEKINEIKKLIIEIEPDYFSEFTD